MVMIREVGQLLEEPRRKKKITQLNVAQAIGVSQSYVSLLDRGALPTTSLSSIFNYAEFVHADIRAIRLELQRALPLIRKARPDLATQIEALEAVPA